MNEPKESRLCISIIAAMSRNSVIGEFDRIPWHLPADLKRFKKLTLGHHVVMGTRTYKSIAPKDPQRNTPLKDSGKGNGLQIVSEVVLEGRIVLVLSRTHSNTADMRIELEELEEKDLHVQGNVRFVPSLDDAIEIAKKGGDTEVFIAGGSKVYKEALGKADKLYLTIVDGCFSGDAFFPDWDRSRWKKVRSIHNEADSRNPYAYTFLYYERA